MSLLKQTRTRLAYSQRTPRYFFLLRDRAALPQTRRRVCCVLVCSVFLGFSLFPSNSIHNDTARTPGPEHRATAIAQRRRSFFIGGHARGLVPVLAPCPWASAPPSFSSGCRPPGAHPGSGFRGGSRPASWIPSPRALRTRRGSSRACQRDSKNQTKPIVNKPTNRGAKRKPSNGHASNGEQSELVSGFRVLKNAFTRDKQIGTNKPTSLRLRYTETKHAKHPAKAHTPPSSHGERERRCFFGQNKSVCIHVHTELTR